ncbi:hypothetical protein H5410_002275 [Solanum commersonii]|uniref:Uncharacterized protein n=1 Tax=Solanum commersonii TaxID=4109 RepID=A0A9J6B1F6_SOLCO|nr:hypothetical protein H5410_002275 [Solanum commersonii]
MRSLKLSFINKQFETLHSCRGNGFGVVWRTISETDKNDGSLLRELISLWLDEAITQHHIIKVGKLHSTPA